jgi:hypothetical protein
MVRPEPTYEQVFSVRKYSLCVASSFSDGVQCVEIPVAVLDIETGKEFAHKGKVQDKFFDKVLMEEPILGIVLKRTSL